MAGATRRQLRLVTSAPSDARAGRWLGNPLGEFRWPAELARLLASPVGRGDGVPRGDEAPVLVIPGFASNDISTWVLRAWLRRLGYVAHPSGIRWNLDCSDRVFGRLDRRLQALSAAAGRRVALVGHSRGGQLARALAANRPECVAAVVALGAGLNDPFAIALPMQVAVSSVRTYHRAVTDRHARRGCLTGTCTCGYGQAFRKPLPSCVPLTSIYASDDGVMRRSACVVPGAVNVEVPGTHVGLAFSAPAFRAVADALAEATSHDTSTGPILRVLRRPGAGR